MEHQSHTDQCSWQPLQSWRWPSYYLPPGLNIDIRASQSHVTLHIRSGHQAGGVQGHLQLWRGGQEH